MSYSEFEDALRRVVTGDDPDGRSVAIIDGGPAEIAAAVGTGGLLEIWTDSVSGTLDSKDNVDSGKGAVVLAPPDNGVKVRWFVIEPAPSGVPTEQLNQAVKDLFRNFGAEHQIIDQTRHPAMHETSTLDIICLIKGDASLILEQGEARLKPGQVVIQRATNHAWVAHGGPALFLAVLIDRRCAR